MWRISDTEQKIKKIKKIKKFSPKSSFFINIYTLKKNIFPFGVLIYVKYKQIQHKKALKQYMHYVNCIYIDTETNYFMLLLVATARNFKNSRASNKLLVNEIVTVIRLLFVTVRCTRLMKLVW